MGDYAKAEPLYQRALAIREKALGPEHPDTATSLNNLAVLYEAMGDYAKAEPLYQRALAIREKALGPEHPDTATSLNNLAVLYKAMGDYAKAEPLFQRALAIREKALGPEHPDTATSLNNLAGLYNAMGDYAKAEPLYQRALAICEKALGPEHPDTATSLNNLAGLYDAMGDYAKAEPLYRRALAIQRKSARPGASRHRNQPQQPGGALPGDGRLRQSRTALPARVGDSAKKRSARSIPTPPPASTTWRSFTARWATTPKPNRSTGARWRFAKKRSARSIPTPPPASTTWRSFTSRWATTPKPNRSTSAPWRFSEKALGPEHPDTATSLNNLAGLYDAMGDYAKAEPLYRRALAIREKALGPEHPDTATSLNNLAGLYNSMGDYAKAEPLYRRALAIREKALGPEHPDTATSLNNLALLNIDLGKAGGALEFAVRAEKAQETQLGNILSFTSEQQRLAFQETTNPFTLVATLGSAPDIAQAILHNKGVVLDSLLEDRLVAEASKDAKQREVIDQLRAAKQRYTQLLMEVPRDFSAEARQRREAELEKRATQVEQLEATLARQVSGLGRARRALSVTLAQVQGALAGDQVLVELLRYRHYMGKNKWEPRYGALVIASRDEPKWIPLGAAAEIEKSIRALSEIRSWQHGRINAALGTSNLARSGMGSHRKGSSCGRQDNHPQSGRRTQFHFLCDTADP